MTTEEFLASMPETLVMYPDPLLFRVCDLVEDFSPWPRIFDRMSYIMSKYLGCGLAAPQVGLPYRAFIFRSSKSLFAVVNPEILEVSARTGTDSEGCLSIPGYVADIVRPHKIKVRWTNPAGREQKATFEGLTARIFQHENDHLQGVLILGAGEKR